MIAFEQGILQDQLGVIGDRAAAVGTVFPEYSAIDSQCPRTRIKIDRAPRMAGSVIVEK